MKKIMIAAGEASGDLHGAELALSLKRLCPSLEVKGIGGSHMKSAGVSVFSDISDLAAVGISEILKNLGKIRRVFYGFLQKMDYEKPDAVVLIDYPGFNMRLAAQAKKRNIKVIYYISPQIWAWGSNRVYSIAKLVDKMLVIFPFEKIFYEKFGIDADYVGHPLTDRLRGLALEGPETSVFPGSEPVVCLLPGSRRQEVIKHLPVMLGAASFIRKSIPGARFVIGRAGTINRDMLSRIARKACLDADILENGRCEAVRMSDFVIASSGTATVESAYFKKPMIVIYRVSPLTWVLARLLVRVRNIAMVNVVAGREIVPEFLQSCARPALIAQKAVSILKDRGTYEKMSSELGEVRKQLDFPGASERAARLVLKTAGVECRER